jgi:nitroreductase
MVPSAESTMALLKARRSVRSYRPDPVPDKMVDQLLQAGRVAPSASNRQPWAFIVIRDKTRIEQVADHATYFFVRWAHVQDAPLIIALCGYRGSRIYRQFLHEDIGLAGGQIMLQARALGLGTCWIGGLNRKALAALLQVPQDWELVGLLTVGFPAEDPEPSPRKPLSDIVHYEVFGNLLPEASPQAVRGPGGVLRTVYRWLSVRIR